MRSLLLVLGVYLIWAGAFLLTTEYPSWGFPPLICGTYFLILRAKEKETER